MDVRPILLSFQTAIIAILFTFVLGTGVAYIVFRLKNRKLKILLNSLFTLPLV
ncbi:molybdate ABC transporter permease, partial [Enterococcus hirae 57-03-H11]